jgi:micrococcal nuclease
MNTPEIYPSVECGGTEAADRNRTLVAGKDVTIIPGPGLYDKYGRRLAYVYVGGVFVNETLVQEGMAELMMIPPNTAYQHQFEILQTAARSKRVGIWRCPNKVAS